MSRASADAGRAWERRAAEYLSGRGLIVLEQGYRCRVGELDLICRHDDALVIVEVRARRTGAHGTAAESVDARKRCKILRATRHYLMRHPELGSLPVRFDVVAVDHIERRDPALEWIENAFDGS